MGKRNLGGINHLALVWNSAKSQDKAKKCAKSNFETQFETQEDKKKIEFELFVVVFIPCLTYTSFCAHTYFYLRVE